VEWQRGGHDAQDGAARDRNVTGGVLRRSPATPTAEARLWQLQRTAGNSAVSMALGASREGRSVGGAELLVQRSVMRGDPRGVAARAGKDVASFDALVLARLEAIVEDSGILPRDVLTGALTDFLAAVARPAPSHPLAQPTVSDQVAMAIHDAQANSAAFSYVSDFVSQVVTNMVVTLPKEADVKQKMTEFRQAAETIFNPYVAAVEARLYTDATRMKNAELRGLVGAVAAANPNATDLLDLAAARHLAQENRPALARTLTEQQKQGMVAALETMPTVRHMYDGTLDQADNAGLHVSQIDISDEVEKQKHFEKHSETFIGNLAAGLSQYGALVEPGARPPDDRVTKIKIEKDPIKQIRKFLFRVEERPEEFRADADRQGSQVRLSIMSDVPTVVHEFGHQVEFNLPLSLWLDLHDILRSRMSSNKLQSIYPGNDQEAGIAADLPGFQAAEGESSARYAAKVYWTGDTELMSMSMQMFSKPATAQAFIRNDPQLAATVLRAIRPTEFNQHFPDNMKLLLPRG
jgi:hypothetical protein